MLFTYFVFLSSVNVCNDSYYTNIDCLEGNGSKIIIAERCIPHIALGQKLLRKLSYFPGWWRIDLTTFHSSIILSPPSPPSSVAGKYEGYMRIKGVIFDRRQQYVECTACNKSRHYQIRADDICFVISLSEKLDPRVFWEKLERRDLIRYCRSSLTVEWRVPPRAWMRARKRYFE